MTTELIQQLLDAGVHFGHQTKRWNPKMKRFIFGSRSGIYLIDLEQTQQCVRTAGEFVESVAAAGQLVLFVGTKKQAKPILEEEAKRAGMPYVVNRWLGGTLTNFHTMKRNIDRMLELRTQKQNGFFERVSKKDATHLSRHLERLESSFSGLADMTRQPGCLFVVDTKREDIAVKEAHKLNIPIVAICDTNSDPDFVNYPIPGNDDAIRAIKLITSMLVESVLVGRRRFLEAQPVVPNTADSDSDKIQDKDAEHTLAEEKTHDKVKSEP